MYRIILSTVIYTTKLEGILSRFVLSWNFNLGIYSVLGPVFRCYPIVSLLRHNPIRMPLVVSDWLFYRSKNPYAGSTALLCQFSLFSPYVSINRVTWNGLLRQRT